ncbi:hypothetical protein ScPMuIL_015040 [Solemya velum]
MGSSDMEDDHSLLDVIDESEFSFVNDGDASASAFSWADDLLSNAEGGDDVIPNDSATITTTSAGLSLPISDGTVQQGSGAAIPGQAGIFSFAPQSFQFLQTSKDVGAPKPVSTLTSAGVVNQFNNAGQGLGTQLVSGNHFILKTASGAQFQLQTQPQFQLCPQPGSTSSSPTNQTLIQQIQPVTSTIPVMTRTATPIQSPVPSSSPLVTGTQNQNSKNVAIVTLPNMSSHTSTNVKSISPSPNVNILHLPGGVSAQPQVIANTLPIQGLLQVQNPNLSSNHGFPQGSTMIPGQGQNIVNTQNTVIQNPNVVNLNVAHVLCNGQTVAGQQASNVGGIHTVQNQVQNPAGIQGTIIQTSDGKSILIPTQQLAGNQGLNLQGLTVQTPVQGTTTSTAGNVSFGNFIRLAQPAGQEKTHFVGVNQHGQQILIQKPAVNPGVSSQPQNIIFRTITPGSNVIQIQQPMGAMAPLAQATQAQVIPAQTQASVMTTHQQGIPAQGFQGQQLKILNQSGIQNQRMPMINIGGQNISLQQLNSTLASQRNLQLVQQQAVEKTATPSVVMGTGQTVQQQIDKARSTPTLYRTTQSFQNLSQNVTTQSIQSSGMVKPITMVTGSNTLVHHQPQQQPLPVTQQQSHVEPAFPQLLSQTAQKTKPQQTLSSVSTSRPPSRTDQIFQPAKMHSTQSEIYREQSSANQSNNLLQESKFPLSQPTPLNTLSSSSPQLGSQGQTTPQQLVTSIQNVSIPVSSFSARPAILSTSSISTANSTTVTTTISQSVVSMSTMNMASSLPSVQVVSSTQGLQTAQGTMSSQVIEETPPPSVVKQAQANVGKLQTIQLTAEAQLQLRQIQTDIKNLTADRNQTTFRKQKIQQLQMLQKTIINQGQIQYLQSLQKNQTPQVPLGPNPQTQSTPKGPAVLGQPQSHKSGIGNSPIIAGQAILSQVLPSLDVKPVLPHAPVQAPAPALAPVEPLVTTTTNATTCVSSLSNTSNQVNLTPKLTVPSTVIHHGAPPGKLPIPATPASQAIPTQIQIGNQLLTVSLNPQQKEKLQSHLAKMTPEQQQLFFRAKQPILVSQQQRQQLEAQIQAQTQMQKQQQQQKLLLVNPQKTNLPVAVQIDKGNPQVKTEFQPGAVSPSRGIKRQVTPEISRANLLLHQLSKDQSLALKPDMLQPFTSPWDACRKLLRYHVFQERLPRRESLIKSEKNFVTKAEELMKRKDAMFSKYQQLLLEESMRTKPSSEMVMIERMLNQDLTSVIEKEKNIAKENPDDFVPMPLQHLKEEKNCAKKIKSEPPDIMEDECGVRSSYDVKQEESATDSSLSGHNESFSTVHIKSEPEQSEFHQSCGKVKLVIRNDGLGFTSAFTPDSDVKKQDLSSSYSSEVSEAEKSEAELNQIYHSTVKEEIMTSDESGTVPLKKYEKRTFSHSDLSFTESENIAETDGDVIIETPPEAVCVSRRSLSVNSVSSNDNVHGTSLHSASAAVFTNHASSTINDIVQQDVGNGDSVVVSETNNISNLPEGGVETSNSKHFDDPASKHFDNPVSKHFDDPESAMVDMESADSLLQESQHAIESIMSGPNEDRHNFDSAASGPNVYNSALYEPISPVSSYQDESMDFDMHVSQFLQNYSVTPTSGMSTESSTNLSEFQSKTVQSSSTSHTITHSHSTPSDHISHSLSTPSGHITHSHSTPSGHISHSAPSDHITHPHSTPSDHTITHSHSAPSDLHSINQELSSSHSSAQNLTNFGYMPEYPNPFPQDGPGETQTVSSSSGIFSESNKLLLPMHLNKNGGNLGEKSPQVISDDDSNSDRMEFSSEPDPQQELLNAQMQSAINSILSLNRESGFTPTTYQLEQAEQTDMYSTDQSESQCEAEDERCEDSTADHESQDSQIDDDLDAAVNSILM